MEGIRKAMNERNLSEGQWEDRKRWSLGVGQRRTAFFKNDIHTCIHTYIHTYIQTNRGKRPLGSHRWRWEDDINTDADEMQWKLRTDFDWPRQETTVGFLHKHK